MYSRELFSCETDTLQATQTFHFITDMKAGSPLKTGEPGLVRFERKILLLSGDDIV